MNCNIALKLLQPYLDHELGPTEAQVLEQHVSHCASCRAAVVGLERAMLAVEALPRAAASPSLHVNVMGQVWAHHRARQRRQNLRGPVASAVLAVLTACGLVFGVYGVYDLVLRLPDLPLDDPFMVLDMLLVIAASMELSHVLATGLFFLAGTAMLVQLTATSRMTRYA